MIKQAQIEAQQYQINDLICNNENNFENRCCSLIKENKYLQHQLEIYQLQAESVFNQQELNYQQQINEEKISQQLSEIIKMNQKLEILDKENNKQLDIALEENKKLASDLYALELQYNFQLFESEQIQKQLQEQILLLKEQNQSSFFQFFVPSQQINSTDEVLILKQQLETLLNENTQLLEQLNKSQDKSLQQVYVSQNTYTENKSIQTDQYQNYQLQTVTNLSKLIDELFNQTSEINTTSEFIDKITSEMVKIVPETEKYFEFIQKYYYNQQQQLKDKQATIEDLESELDEHSDEIQRMKLKLQIQNPVMQNIYTQTKTISEAREIQDIIVENDKLKLIIVNLQKQLILNSEISGL
ncbi:Hypothetical_protein [Hexamita inflata]|uniref:Hypothetical_protein n=1 Tax=Hexamita inflata TaxID=28002 RepID=A0AA86NAV7_9EUKA|nr:Hypothetical protein HINF_LOCUS3939 [Hexamita inflata]